MRLLVVVLAAALHLAELRIRSSLWRRFWRRSTSVSLNLEVVVAQELVELVVERDPMHEAEKRRQARGNALEQGSLDLLRLRLPELICGLASIGGEASYMYEARYPPSLRP